MEVKELLHNKSNITGSIKNTKIKLAIICYGHFDATLGLGKYLKLIASQIKIDFIFIDCQEKTTNVDIRGNSFNNGVVDEKSLKNALGDEIFDYMGPDIRLWAFYFNSLKIADIKNYQLLWQFRKTILKKEYDVLHFVGNNPWIILLNAVINGSPKVHTIHEPYPFSPMTRYRMFRHNLAVKIALRASSHVVVPSGVSYIRLMKHFNTRDTGVSVFPLGIFDFYKGYLKKEVATSENILLYFGSISEYKGVSDLLSAMNIVAQKNPDIKLIVAGRGKIDYDLSNLPGNIEVINRFLSNTEVAELNQMASVVICPYRRASQSGVIMTSFAFGNPVIATDVGAFSDMVEHKITGLLVAPHNIALLGQAIIEIFEDKRLIKDMRSNIANMYKYKEKSWWSIAKKHLELYVNCVGIGKQAK